MDRRTGRIRLDRALFTATGYPADYGFIERTVGEDTDPLAALVLVQEPTFPGCLIRCRAIGMFRARREGARPEGPVRAHFFEVHRDLEPGKSVDIERGIWAVWSRRSGVPYGWRSRLREALLQTPAACLKIDRREDS